MYDPIQDDIENDPELQDLISDIEDEIFLIEEEESENFNEYEMDELDDDEDVFDRLGRGNRGEWHDEYD